jgi:hypothetical protein
MPCAALLFCTPTQLQLTYVNLRPNGFCVPATSFGGLTASSCTLQELHLTCKSVSQRAWEAILPPGLRLPCLTRLALTQLEYQNNGEEQLGFNTAALSRLADCCASNLRALTLGWRTNRQPGCVALDSLARFMALTSLSLNCVTAQAATQVLPRLTSLRALHILPPSHVLRPDGLLRLTALRQLSHLTLPEESSRDSDTISITSQVRGAACCSAYAAVPSESAPPRMVCLLYLPVRHPDVYVLHALPVVILTAFVLACHDRLFVLLACVCSCPTTVGLQAPAGSPPDVWQQLLLRVQPGEAHAVNPQTEPQELVHVGDLDQQLAAHRPAAAACVCGGRGVMWAGASDASVDLHKFAVHGCVHIQQHGCIAHTCCIYLAAYLQDDTSSEDAESASGSAAATAGTAETSSLRQQLRHAHLA